MSKLNKKITKVFEEAINDVTKARLYALNRAARSAHSEAIKFIRSKYNIKASTLRDNITLYSATKNKPLIKIYVGHKPIGLIKYSSRPTARPKRYRTGKVGGTKVTIKKGDRQLRKHAFKATIKGHDGIFIRTGNKTKEGKENIKELYGPSAMQLFSIEEVQNVLEKKFYERVNIEFDTRMRYLNSK